MTGEETGHSLYSGCMKEDRRQTADDHGEQLLVNHQLFVIPGTRNRTEFSA